MNEEEAPLERRLMLPVTAMACLTLVVLLRMAYVRWSEIFRRRIRLQKLATSAGGAAVRGTAAARSRHAVQQYVILPQTLST